MDLPCFKTGEATDVLTDEGEAGLVVDKSDFSCPEDVSLIMEDEEEGMKGAPG